MESSEHGNRSATQMRAAGRDGSLNHAREKHGIVEDGTRAMCRRDPQWAEESSEANGISKLVGVVMIGR